MIRLNLLLMVTIFFCMEPILVAPVHAQSKAIESSGPGAFYVFGREIFRVDPVTRDREKIYDTGSIPITAIQDESPTTFLIAAGTETFTPQRPRRILRVHKQTGHIEVFYDSVEVGFLSHVSGTEYLGVEPGGTVLAKLWYDGIMRWDPVAGSVTAFEGMMARPRSPYINDMEVTADGLVYYCIRPVSSNKAQGLFSIDPESKVVLEVGMELPISRFEFDSKGKIIALTHGNGIVQIDPISSDTQTLSPDTNDYKLLDIDVTRDDRIFVGYLDVLSTATSMRERLVEFIPDTFEFQLYSGIMADSTYSGIGDEFKGSNFIVFDPIPESHVSIWEYE